MNQEMINFVLPPSLITKADVARLVDEFERLDDTLTRAEIHNKTGGPQDPSPRLSQSLTDFLASNHCDLHSASERSEMIHQLRRLKDTVPVIHLTFSTEADATSLGQLADWFRREIHQQAVLAIGLQPSLIAGVYLRTPNRVHDFSLRSKLRAGRGLIAKDLEALGGRS